MKTTIFSVLALICVFQTLESAPLFSADDFETSVSIAWNDYLPLIRFNWKGAIESKITTKFAAGASIQIAHMQSEINIAIVKDTNTNAASLQFWTERDENELVEARAAVSNVICENLTCILPNFNLEDIGLYVTLEAIDNEIRVYVLANLHVTFKSSQIIRGLAPGSYYMKSSEYTNCDAIPVGQITMKAPIQYVTTAEQHQNHFLNVITNIQSTCSMKMTITSPETVVFIGEADEIQPVDIPQFSIPNYLSPGNQDGVCNRQEWADVPLTCRDDTKICGGTTSFDYQLNYLNAKPNYKTWTNIYYPIIIREYFALEVSRYLAFYTPIGYTGFQPHPNNQLRVIFSSFSAASYVINTDLCSNGADGGPGTSCANVYSNFEINKLYMIRIKRIGRTEFVAHLLDEKQELLEIGSFGFVDIESIDSPGNGAGFIENFDYGFNMYDSCCDAAPVSALIYGPVSTDAGGAYSSNMNWGQYGTTCSTDAFNVHGYVYSVDVKLPNSDTSLTSQAVLLYKGWKDSPYPRNNILVNSTLFE